MTTSNTHFKAFLQALTYDEFRELEQSTRNGTGFNESQMKDIKAESNRRAALFNSYMSF